MLNELACGMKVAPRHPSRVSGVTPMDLAPGRPGIERLVAPNPGPMTLGGTNTYLYGADPCVVIDPGPADPRHAEAIRRAAERRGGFETVLLTHLHGDHADAAPLLGVTARVPEVGGAPPGLNVLPTPGHAPEHVCLLTDSGECFSGDLLLGEGSTFVPPEGEALIAYLSSLERLRDEDVALICPGHGPWVTDPAGRIRESIEHKMTRERRLVAALDRGERSRAALLAEVWDDVPEELRPAASAVMTAHLEKLRLEGRLTAELSD